VGEQENAPDPRARKPGAPGSGARARAACPSCGSARTQPFAHAGPGARVNMKCLDCGTLFKDKGLRT
jgi:uncharacterized Zn finger protein